jgi:hypothetical protein
MQVMFTVVGVVAVIISVLVIVYLLVLVFLLQRRHVRAAFAAWGLPAEANDLPEREEADEGWRRPTPPRNPEDDERFR